MKEETLAKIKNEFENKKDALDNIDGKYDENFAALKMIDTIRDDYSKEIEEDNNGIFFYYKSYYYSRTIADDIINVPYGSKNEDFRRYVNLETGEGIDIFKTSWEEFESRENVIIPESRIFTYNDFANYRAKFILDAMENGQEKAVQRVLKK